MWPIKQIQFLCTCRWFQNPVSRDISRVLLLEWWLITIILSNQTAEELIARIQDHESRLLEELETRRQTEYKKVGINPNKIKEIQSNIQVKSIPTLSRSIENIASKNKSIIWGLLFLKAYLVDIQWLLHVHSQYSYSVAKVPCNYTISVYATMRLCKLPSPFAPCSLPFFLILLPSYFSSVPFSFFFAPCSFFPMLPVFFVHVP